MHKLKLILLAAAAAVLGACSGGSDDTLTAPPVGPGGPAPVVSTLTLLTSNPQISSDGAATATISALVRDANNNVMPNVTVVFTASSGSLAVAQPSTTNDDGVLTATLSTAGDPTNRTITITGLAGTASSQVSVNVIGSTLALTGPASLPTGSTGAFSVKLQNAANAGISGATVTVTSSRANGISQTPLTTNALGEASFTLAANNSGADTLTVSALGIQTTLVVTVSSDAFTFTAPALNAEVALGAAANITTHWTQGGAAVANQTITFATSRGTLSPAGTALTNASGDATITVSASNAGPALLTATNSAGTSIQRAIEFVATTPTVLELQAAPFTVATGDQSALTAIVRDANGNLVKNKIVTFTLDDITGGSLSVAQSTTDSQGRATTTYSASSTTSAVGGVHVRATVQGTPAATDLVDLTVARREVFISIGTGNQIDEPNTAQYRKEWIIQVTDAQGNGVNNVNVTVSVLSVRYWDGIRVFNTPVWTTRPGIEALPVQGCPDEDVNRNGILSPGADANTNGRIEAGNILSVAPHGGTGNKVTTDANGFALLDVFYPQEYAYWLEVTLQATTSVQGTEFAESTTFVPPGSALDFGTENTAPPGVNSPFGTDGVCATPPPPDGP